MTAQPRSFLFWTLMLMGILLVFYLSWIPNPDFKSHWYFPVWLSQWTNKHGQLRTAVPFLFLGLLIEYYLKDDIHLTYRFGIWTGLVIVVVIAEFGQLFLPNRHFDWIDILWGGVGGGIGMIVGYQIRQLFQKQ